VTRSQNVAATSQDEWGRLKFLTLWPNNTKTSEFISSRVPQNFYVVTLNYKVPSEYVRGVNNKGPVTPE